MAKKPIFPVTGDAEADALLVAEPLALLLGMLLDQQIPMEWAFRGPATLKGRLGRLDAGDLAAMDPDDLLAAFKGPPALHRFPGSMATRTQAVCRALVEGYDGDAAKLWAGTTSAKVVYDRLRELPGYGDEKTRIFLAILVKRMGVRLDGWEEVAAPFSDDEPRSVADIDSRARFDDVRAWKKMMKAKGKAKTD
jgi:uncharacterized HhH-GPD family protein